MKNLFKVRGKLSSGTRNRLFSWNPKGHLLAVATNQSDTNQKKIVLYDRQGAHQSQINVSVNSGANVSENREGDRITHLEWDSRGERLAVICSNSASVLIWVVNSGETFRVDAGLKHDILLVSWHLHQSILAIGTSRGALVLYDDEKKKRIPIVGKHSKGIICGCWSSTGLLALASLDNQFSISKANGDAISQMAIKGEPVEIQFSPSMKQKADGNDALHVSINVSRKSLFIVQVNGLDSESSMLTERVPGFVELEFGESHGRIMVHTWYGPQYIVVGTDLGYIIIASTEKNKAARQMHPFRFFREGLSDISISFNTHFSVQSLTDDRKDAGAEAEKAERKGQTVLACCGNKSILLLDITSPSSVTELTSYTFNNTNDANVEKAKAGMEMKGQSGRRGSLYRWTGPQNANSDGESNDKSEFLQWTCDGQILSVSTVDGTVHSLLVSLPVIGSGFGCNIAYLTSIAEISVVQTMADDSTVHTKSLMQPENEERNEYSENVNQKSKSAIFPVLWKQDVKIEPAFCVLGPHDLAVGLNNECWFFSMKTKPAYAIKGMGDSIVSHFDYIASIHAVKLNSNYAAVLSEGRIHLHNLNSINGTEDQHSMHHQSEIHEKHDIVLPYKDASADVSCIELTENFLIAGTTSGSIMYWLLSDPISNSLWEENVQEDNNESKQSSPKTPPKINEYRHSVKKGNTRSFPGDNSMSANSDLDQGSQASAESQYCITSITACTPGTRMIFSDARRHIFLFNAVNDQVLPVTPPPGTSFIFANDQGNSQSKRRKGTATPIVLWDNSDRNVFIIIARRSHGESLENIQSKNHNNNMKGSTLALQMSLSDMSNQVFIVVYTYIHSTTSGPDIKLVGMHAMRSLPGKPLLLSKGYLICHTNSGMLEQILLDTHKQIMAKHSLQLLKTNQGKRSMNTNSSTSLSSHHHDRLIRDEFDQHLALGHLEEAKEIAIISGDKKMWMSVASYALNLLQVELAMASYRMAGDASKASSLSQLLHVEDKHLLSGHALLLLGSKDNTTYKELLDIAEAHFLQSSCPVAALEMRVDLKDWDRALELAESMQLTCVERGHIYQQHASTMELKGEYESARRAYDEAIRLYNESSYSKRSSDVKEANWEENMFGDYDPNLSIESYGHSQYNDRGRNSAMEDKADDPMEDQSENIHICRGGIARCLIFLGDINAGVQIALDLASMQEHADGESEKNIQGVHIGRLQMFKEFANILEQAGHSIQAAEMHQVCGNTEQAATLFIKAKQFDRAYPLMGSVHIPRLHQLFARAMEMRGELQLALSSYQKANDCEALVRLYLGNNDVHNPHKAFALVRQTRSLEAAKLVRQYCIGKGDFDGQIEMLVILGKVHDALGIATVHKAVDTLVKCLSDTEADVQEYLSIAKYYEQHGQFFNAAKMYERCCKVASLKPNVVPIASKTGSQYDDVDAGTATEFIEACNSSAVQFYLKDGTSKAIDSAIALVGRTRSTILIAQVVDWLAAQTEASASAASKEGAKYLFELHIALGDLPRAAHVACVVARQEQEMGNYKLAHEQIVQAMRELRNQLDISKPEEDENADPVAGKADSSDNSHILTELYRIITILHSYILVKTHVKVGDHTTAARLLIRVSKHISRFPAHIVPILTSTVIECQRAGFKWAAFEHASILMRDPDYRTHIAPAYKRKIEAIIRKPDPNLKSARQAMTNSDPAQDSKGLEGTDDAKEGLSPCPSCSSIGPEYDLQCLHCKTRIPFCSATGKRMVADDWGSCINCNFPFRSSAMMMLMDKGEQKCLMCSAELSSHNVKPKAFKKHVMLSGYG